MTQIGSAYGYGDAVAWARLDAEGSATVWSTTHRVFKNGWTFCSRAVPTSSDYVVVHDRKSGGTCSRCARMYARSRDYFSKAARNAAESV